MKAIRRISGAGLVVFGLLIVCSGLVGKAAAQANLATGTQYCEVSLTGCPQDYDGRELRVPLKVIAMSSQVKACGIASSTEGGGAAAPAIMFLVDHTTSMISSGANDPNGNRFRVTKALIDTIYKVVPDAQIGLALFGPGFIFGPARDSNVVAFTYNGGITADRTTQYFLPLLQLNQRVRSGFANRANAANPTGYTLYSNMFYIPTRASDRAGVYANNNNNNIIAEVGGTNISIAFEAAIQEFQRINAANGIAKENQYIIFLSDGEPSPTVNNCTGSNANNPRCPMQNDFIDITSKLVPTTYTVFLSSSNNPQPPVPLVDMTRNIRNNGYSTSNPSSDIWAISADYSGLLTLMMDNIISPMLSKSEGSVKNIVIQSGGARDSTGNVTDGNFTFSRRLPIDTTEVTTVEMGVRYDVKIDSTFWNNLTGKQDTITRLVRDSLFMYSFTIQRTATISDTSTNWLASQNLGVRCGTKPDLALLFGTDTLGSSTTSRVKEVKGNMDRLTIRFDNTNGLFDYDRVTVQVLNTDGTLSDLENFNLTKSGNIWTASFPRVVASTAQPGDGRLQHASQDSIVLFFRNPQIPLDVIRIAVPYVSTTMAFYDGPGTNARKYNDTLTVTAGEEKSLYAIFFDSDGNRDTSIINALVANPSRITWTINDRSATLTGNGAHGVFYGETAGRVYTVTATYKDGPLVIQKSIEINIVPGQARYLEVVFDTTKIVPKADTTKLKDEKVYEFGKDESKTTFYVVERDKFGNLIGPAAGSTWTSNNTDVIRTDATGGDGSSALVTRHSFGSGITVTVTKGGITDKVNIRLTGESTVTVGPNPFDPRKDTVEDMLDRIGATAETRQIYENIIAGGSVGGGNTTTTNTAGNTKGVLVATTSPKVIKGEGEGKNKVALGAMFVIYDAVGNVVYKSKPGDVKLSSDDVTYGFVWNGTNMSGRTVGPGTYLVRMVATQKDTGAKYTTQRKIGVTVR